MPFSGFTAADFAAYEQKKWESNVFTLERLQVKQKLTALGREVAPTLLAADGSLLELELSAEHPALWNHHKVDRQYLFFSRNKDERRELEGIIDKQRTMASMIEDPSPLRNHIFLSVMIDVDQLEVALKLHSAASVDRENLHRRCQEFFEREKLLSLIRGLPEPFTVGIEPGTRSSAAALDDDGLQALVRELADANSWLTVSRRFERDDPQLVDGAFSGVARDLLGRLLEIMHFIAWTRDNDHLSMRETLQQQEVQKKAKGLEKGDRVRVVRGIFSGKTGTVQGVDAKGGLKVQLGPMAAKLAGDDVTKI